MRHAAALVALLGLLAGCDLPADPPALNPYDPAFDGARQATAPSDLRLAASSAASISLAWTDNSSFETGVRVERAVVVPFGSSPRYETVAVLPPDATAYTEAVDVAVPRRYRVVALVAGGSESAPSPTLRLDYLPERRAVTGPEPVAAAAVTLSDDGQTLYAGGRTRLYALDVATGATLGAYGGASQVSGFLDDGRIAVALTANIQPPAVRFYRGFALTASYALPQATCSVSEYARVAVSADGLRAIAACPFYGAGGSTAIGVWTFASAGPPRLVPFGVGGSGNGGDVVGISADGRIAVGGNDFETVAVDATDGRVLWRVPEPVVRAALSPDGRRVVTSTPERASLRDAATGAVLASAAGGLFRPTFSRDGSRIGSTAPTPFGEGYRIVRADDLAPVVVLPANGSFTVPTATGAVGLDVVRFPDVDLLRWDFSRGWTVVAESGP